VLVADEDGVCTTEIIPFRCYGDFVPEYFKLALSSPYFLNYVKARSYGMKMPRLGTADARNAAIPLPPLAEQARIVARVEELMRLCDALETQGQLEAAQHTQLVTTLLGTLTNSANAEELAANWQRVAAHFDLLLDRPEAIDSLEQTILQLAVRGLLVPQDPNDEPASALLQKIRAEKDRMVADRKVKRDKPLPPITDDEKTFALPNGWQWLRVADVVEMLNGYAFKSDWFNAVGVRLLRNLNVSHGFIDWSTPAAIDTQMAEGFQAFALKAGDIVLSLDRPIISTGLKYAVVQEADLPCLLLQRVARLAPSPEAVTAEYFALWLQSDSFVGTIDPGRSNGVPHISTKQVGALPFTLPPLAEQSRIVARVEELRSLCAKLRRRLVARQTTQARLAEALIAEAV
jgi:type I restriction enzyme S subunit